MRLLAASYNNIGPLVEQHVLLNILPGATLITAPIGTGKSFLFFDGPIFGLYKIQQRPILNRLATRGEVRVVFERSGSLRAIHRVLKRASSGSESVQTQLFSLSYTTASRQTFAQQQRGTSVVVYESDLGTLLAPFAEEHHFGSQREADQGILDLLPPKEVVLSVNFLMQEAESVFDLTPADRIQVFKHLFGLLGIDEAKEVLLEKRRQIQATLKSMSDHTVRDTKVRSYVKQIALARTRLLECQLGPLEKTHLQAVLEQPLVQDSTLVAPDMNIREDILDGYDASLVQRALQRVEQTKAALIAEQSRHAVYTTSLQQLQERKKMAHLRLLEGDKKRQSLHQALQHTQTIDNDALLAKQQSLRTAYEATTQSVDLSLFAKPGETIDTLEVAKARYDAYVQEGITIKQRIQSLEQTIKQSTEEQQAIEKQRVVLSQQSEQLKAQLLKTAQFMCDKIGNLPCPYVDLIKGASTKTLGQHQEALIAQQEVLQQRQTLINERLGEQHASIILLQEELEALRALVASLPYKALVEAMAIGVDLKKQIMENEQSYVQAQAQQAQQQKQQQELVALDATIVELQRTIAGLAEEESILTKQMQGSTVHDFPTPATLDAIIEALQQLTTQATLLQQLVAERSDHQKRYKALEQRETMLKQLGDIFGKELMYVVLQDFLPQLETIINAFLAQLVEYTLHFSLPQASDEKMELTIEVKDEKGARQVKSLSGGQKSMLKFARIMAVTALFDAEFVFLDETMNSLDQDAVARVAQVLQDALVQKDIPFYCITHAPQIQALTFWKRTLVLSG